MGWPRRVGAIASLVILGSLVGRPASATAFTVTNTNDSGAGSLRQAITDANLDATPDTIAFNISGGGVHTITPLTALPNISTPVVIDGYTQPGSKENSLAFGTNAVPAIEIDGSNLVSANALTFVGGSAGSTVRGLVINGAPSTGQGIRFAAGSNAGYHIEGCFIGTNAAGTAADPNGGGIFSSSGGGITVGGADPADRNIISGNTLSGVALSSSLTSNSAIVNNLIGVDKSGSPLPNGEDGVTLVSNTTGNRIVDNVISSDNDAGDLGIDLNDDGVTPNDGKDKDTGPNGAQNFPVLTSAKIAPDGPMTIVGKLKSTPRKLYTIQFFANEAGDEPDGEIPLGQLNVRTNRFGVANFRFISVVTTAPSQTVTATATRFDTNDTSEFSAPVTAVAA